MKAWNLGAGVAVAGLAFGLMAATPAQAITAKECRTNYDAAKKAGGTMKYADYRKANCAASAAAPAAQPAAAKASAMKSAATMKAAPAAASGSAVFPTAVDSKYSNLKAGEARRKTCDDQYKANQKTNSNGGLKWIQTGGGYYSECNKKLKG